jgi:RNA polymerase sigma-70 factor, ECF subfamily
MSVGRGTAGSGRSGDDAQFAAVYARCYRPIRDYCSRRVPAEAVDDAVADTFLTVWRRLDEVPAGDEALVWLYGVAFRVIGHQWRSTARRSRLQERLRSVGSRPVAAADESTVDGDEHRIVLAALARVGDTDAEVLRLVAWEQLSVVDVAAVLRIEPDAARQRLHRARRNLVREYERLQSRPTSTPAAPTGGAR